MNGVPLQAVCPEVARRHLNPSSVVGSTRMFSNVTGTSPGADGKRKRPDVSVPGCVVLDVAFYFGDKRIAMAPGFDAES
jgi:hypothetical protein